MHSASKRTVRWCARLLSLSIAVVALTRCGGDGGTDPDPEIVATIIPSMLAVSFDGATGGGGNPPRQVVSITNGGGGTLSGLQRTVEHHTSPQGWLTTTLASSTAPTDLAIDVSTGPLPAGTYRATLTISSPVAKNSVAIPITFVVAVGLPSAPSALVATPFSGSRIDLAWTDNVAGEDGFRIERCAGAGCSNFAQVGTVSANVASYVSTALLPLTTYSFRVRAFNSAGTSGYSNVATAATPALAIPPAAPSALGATAISATQMNLAWTDNAANEDGFRVERCSGAGCSTFTEIASVAAGVTTYQSTGLSASTSYSYRVRAYNAVGNSGYSNVATGVTLAVAIPPAAPSGLTATAASASQINLAWTDNATNEGGFRVERCSGAGCSGFAEIASVAAGVTTYQSTGLSASTSYSYRVRAYNSAGNSGSSNVATAVTPSIVVPPAAPSALTATAASASQINLAWTDNAGNEDGFRIERCSGVGCSNYAELTTVGANVTSYQNTGLSAATTYMYRVRAYNAAGNSGYAGPAGATTQSVAPAAPTSLIATTASASQINLAWTDNSTNESGFRVEMCTGASCTIFTELGTVAANVVAEPITELAAGTTYRFRIRAYNGAGNSSYSNIASATTTTSARRINLINQVPTSVFLDEIVRLKLAANESGFGDSDLLSDDRYTSCLSLPANYIQSGSQQSFPQSIGNNYSVWISLGLWELNSFTCPTSAPWIRTTSFQTTDFKPHYVYVIVNITGHTGGTLDFRVFGSYLNGTLKVEVSQNGSVWGTIPFTITP